MYSTLSAKNKGKMLKTLAVYAQEDMGHFKEFDKSTVLLKRDGLISPIGIHEVDPGTNSHEDLIYKIKDADIFIFFVSPDLIACSFYEYIVKEALRLRKEEHKLIIPILSRQCDKDERLHQFEALPHKDQYITNHPQGASDCINSVIIQKFRKLVEDMPTRPKFNHSELGHALKEFNYNAQKSAFRSHIQKKVFTNLITAGGTKDCGLNFMSKIMLYRHKLLSDWDTVSTINVKTERFFRSILGGIKFMQQEQLSVYIQEQLPSFWDLIRDQLFPKLIYTSPDQIAKAIFDRMRYENVIVCLDNHNTLMSPLIRLFWDDFLRFYENHPEKSKTEHCFILFILHKSQDQNAIFKMEFAGQVQDTYLALEPVREMTHDDLEEWFSEKLPTGSKDELSLTQDKYLPVPLLEIICKHYGYSQFFEEHIKPDLD